MEQTLVLAKPDAIHRGHIGEIIKRIEDLDLTLLGIKMMSLSDQHLTDHYAHLTDKPFFPDIVKFMQSAPVVAMVWEGENAVQKVRDLTGVTDSRNAGPGTLRGDLGIDVQFNLIHASDTPENAQAEVTRFFDPKELFNYTKEPEQFPVKQ